MTNLNDIKIESCSSSDLVAYLYGEMNAAERNVFETHLAGCSPCTDEFADLSFARLDVYEWHRDEFASMATPQFVIPYAETAVKAPWLAGLRGFFGPYGQWATAAGAFAIVGIVFGTWFVSSMTKSTEFVENAPNIYLADKNQSEPKSKAPSVVETRSADDPFKTDGGPSIIKVSSDTKKPIQVKAVTRKPARTPQLDVAQRILPKKVPRLNDFEDEDDNTLRLGDLLADVDTRKN